MKFLKFPSIVYHELYTTNKENAERLAQFEHDNSDLIWVITEKIDGSNFGLCVTLDDYQVQKRNGLIENEHQDIWGLFKGKDRFKILVDNIREKIKEDSNIEQMIFYGEWFGKGIMKRIYYGEDHYFRFFGITTINKDGHIIDLPYQTLYTWMIDWNMQDHLVDPLLITTSLKSALEYPNNFKSEYTPSNSITEGIVISPWNKNSWIRFKSKNEKFKEENNNVEEQKKIFANDEVEQLHQSFKNLCTESRMFGIFSKIGMPGNGIKDASIYIKTFILDALDDLKQIEPKYNDLEQKDRKYITSIGKIPFNLFKDVWIKLSHEA